MPDLVFTIKTPAELQGAEAAARAMEVAIGKAKALGEEYGHLEARLERVRASIEAFKQSNESAQQATDDTARYAAALEELDRASHEAKATEAQRLIDLKNTTKATEEVTDTTQKLGSQTEEASEVTKLFAGHTGEVKRAIQELSREFPVAGLALKAFSNPIAAALTLAIGLFVILKRHIDEINAKMDEAEAVAARSFGNIVESVREAKTAIEKANEAFADWLEKLNQDPQAGERAFDATIESLHQQRDATLEIIDAQKALALAKIAAAEAANKADPTQGITSDQAGKLRAQVETDFGTRREATTQQAEEAELSKRQSEISELTFKQRVAERTLNRAAIAANDPARAAELIDIPKKIKDTEEQKAGYKPQLDAATKTRQELEEELAASSNPFAIARAPDVVERKLNQAREEEEKLKLVMWSFDSTAKKLRNRKTEIEGTIDKDFEEAKADYSDRAGVIRSRSEQLETFQTRTGIDSTKRAVVLGLNNQTRAVESGVVESGAANLLPTSAPQTIQRGTETTLLTMREILKAIRDRDIEVARMRTEILQLHANLQGQVKTARAH